MKQEGKIPGTNLAVLLRIDSEWQKLRNEKEDLEVSSSRWERFQTWRTRRSFDDSSRELITV